MNYLIQKYKDDISLDSEIALRLMKEKFSVHTYKFVESIEDLEGDTWKECIPLGDLEFVGDWLRRFHGIDHLYPIEVPEILRKDEFLGREYSIVRYEDIPNSGRYFIKDADNLKHFSFIGDLEYVKCGQFREDLDKSGLYQVSSEVNIVSEYRVIVLDDKIISVDFYNGVSEQSNGGVPGVLVFPNTKWLQKAVNIYSIDRNRPRAYTMDIAILKDGTNIILEVHDFISCGIYSTVHGDELLYAYNLGIDWVISGKNKRLTEWTNRK